MRPACRLTAVLPEDGIASRPARSHRRRCLRCQAAAARTRGLLRQLAALDEDVEPAPPGLAEGVVARLGHQDASDPRRRLVAALAARYAAAGVAAATAAAVVTGLARHRPRLPG